MSDTGIPLLSVRDVTKQFTTGGLRSRGVRAVAGVSLDVHRSEIVAVVGESGSGKTTLGNCISGLLKPSSGQIRLEGVDLASAPPKARASLRRRIQPVFQDPRASLDPRWTVGRTIREALDANRIGRPKERRGRTLSLMDLVGLPRHVEDRLPHQLSGGQQQRVAIGAALALQPELLVADEPVSALDVSVQAQILNLFEALRAELGLAVIFISHDLSVVEHMSDRVAVMYLGRVVEIGSVDQVFDHPKHPYTKALLAAIPRADPAHRGAIRSIGGEAGGAAASTGGCAFAPRCPLAVERCRSALPELIGHEPGHEAACFVAEEALRATPA